MFHKIINLVGLIAYISAIVYAISTLDPVARDIIVYFSAGIGFVTYVWERVRAILED